MHCRMQSSISALHCRLSNVVMSFTPSLRCHPVIFWSSSGSFPSPGSPFCAPSVVVLFQGVLQNPLCGHWGAAKPFAASHGDGSWLEVTGVRLGAGRGSVEHMGVHLNVKTAVLSFFRQLVTTASIWQQRIKRTEAGDKGNHRDAFFAKASLRPLNCNDEDDDRFEQFDVKNLSRPSRKCHLSVCSNPINKP